MSTFNPGEEVYVRATDSEPGHTGTVAFATETEVLVRDSSDNSKQQWVDNFNVEKEQK